MERLSRWAGLAAATAAFSQQAAAAPLAPTGKWVVNYANAECLASRDYGTADKPLALILKAPAMGDVVQLMVARKGTFGPGAEQVSGQVRFAGAPARKISALAYTPDKAKYRVVLYNLKRVDVAAWPTSGTLSVQAGGLLRQELQVTDLGPLLRVMDECVADLRSHWNYSDHTIASKHRQRVAGDLTGLIRPEDYPAVNSRGNETGRVRTVLLVDTDGKVADCSLIETSGVAALDAQTCALISSRARFQPAIGSDGKPARDMVVQQVTWQLRH